GAASVRVAQGAAEDDLQDGSRAAHSAEQELQQQASRGRVDVEQIHGGASRVRAHAVRVHAIIDVAATSIEARTCDYGRESGNSRALGGFGDLWGPAGPGTGGGDEEGEGGGAA